MRVMLVHADLFVLAGNLRAMLMIADTLKYLGHEVEFIYSDIRPRQAWFWKPLELRRYHPVKYLQMTECTDKGWKHLRYCGDFLEAKHPHLKIIVYNGLRYGTVDIMLTDEPALLWFSGECPYLYHVHYVHYPDRARAPQEYVTYMFNSSYTADLAAYWWSVRGYVVHPPLWTDLYKYRDYSDRDIDVVFFGQMYRVKGFNLAEKLADRGYRVAVIGAYVGDYKPSKRHNIEVYVNADFPTYRDVLSRSKVYIHARPGEHFGITITEAMASGTPAIVHRSGGQWTDIALHGRYAQGWSTIQELFKKVEILTKHRVIWEDWSIRALERVMAFDVRRVAQKIKTVLGNALERKKLLCRSHCY